MSACGNFMASNQPKLAALGLFSPIYSSYTSSLRYQQCLDHKEYDIMRLNFKAMESYGDGNRASQAVVADKVELIQMLFDGLLESLVTARGHIEHGAIEEKSKSLVRAGRIVIGLQGALDLDKGGDLARNLHELYSYVTRRLVYVNAHNDLNVLNEVQTLMTEIRQAWRDVPNLLPKPAPLEGATLSAAMH